jgi:pyridoxal 5'-phosphate synthase pdxT subunit
MAIEMSEGVEADRKTRVGIVALQGDFEAHLKAVQAAGGEPFLVRAPEQLTSADALILPGGESTTIGKLMARFGIDHAIAAAHAEGKPIYGTCAGMILLAKRITSGEMRGGQPTLGLMDIGVARNAFGRQLDSFETEIDTEPEVTGEDAENCVHGVFIRAPYVTDIGADVRILARYQGRVVLVRQGSLLASAFHPELTGDSRVHRYFLRMTTARARAGSVR